MSAPMATMQHMPGAVASAIPGRKAMRVGAQVGPGAPVGYEVTPGKTRVLPSAQLPTCA